MVADSRYCLGREEDALAMRKKLKEVRQKLKNRTEHVEEPDQSGLPGDSTDAEP